MLKYSKSNNDITITKVPKHIVPTLTLCAWEQSHS